MRTLYRAYCRSVTRVQCSGFAVLIAIVLAAVITYGGARYVTVHQAAILAGLRDAASVVAVLGAAGILAAMAYRLSRATGAHCDTAPAELKIDHAKPWSGPEPAREPGTYTWTIKPAAEAAMAERVDAVFEDAEAGS